MIRPAKRRFVVAAALAAALAVSAGCASRPINERIDAVDPASGYRADLRLANRPNNDPRTLLVLAFSGGGTRAAALSYGVLEALRASEVIVDGQRRRLLDEVDLITGVSGGARGAGPGGSRSRDRSCRCAR